MKTTAFLTAFAAACLPLASCETTTAKKKKAEDTQPAYSRYLQDESQQSGAAPATNPDGAPAVTPGTDTPPVPPAPNTNVSTNTPPPPVTPPIPATSQVPYGKPVPGKKGFVYSPFSDSNQMIDVRDYTPGTKVRDPYTNKIFLVP